MLQKFDPKNENILVYVNGKLYPRSEAKVSVFDSAVQGGDAVWEGLRIYNGKIFALEQHLDRLHESAHALDFEAVPDNETIIAALRETLQANKMEDGVHIRLTLTRGEKYTSGMDPRLNTKGCTLIILPEWKAPVYDREGISLITSAIRRNNPNHLDSKIHHNNLLNNILAKIEANIAGADDALMLDINGFVAETNATNIFLIKSDTVITPTTDSCLPGITRGVVIDICRDEGIELLEKNISLTECYNADFIFISGTMGELVRVKSIDGRSTCRHDNHPVFIKINDHFHTYTIKEGFQIY